jgi:2-polyprenyl-3-methyl-5-hydroxy-6-metoxy-1,4-benzoquinol methylase
MSLLCPTCRNPIDPTALACSHGHQFAHEDGVLVLLEETFGGRLQTLSAALSAMRTAENKRLLDVSAYEDLPFAKAVRGNFEWRMRGYDLALIRKLQGNRQRQQILDLGAANGWLSHRLAALGHDVTAVEYFADEYDGLRSKKFYRTTWQAIQMDLTDLSVLNQRYDVVIVNHGLHFFPDPLPQVMAAKQKVAPGGLLILIGLQFFRDPTARAHRVTALQQTFRERCGCDLFLRPTKGYLDFADKARLQDEGIVLHLCPQLWLANLKSMLNKNLPRYYYGVWRQPTTS